MTKSHFLFEIAILRYQRRHFLFEIVIAEYQHRTTAGR